MCVKAVIFDLGNTLVTRLVEDKFVLHEAFNKAVDYASLKGCKIDYGKLRSTYIEQRKRHEELRMKYLVEIHMRSWICELLSSVCESKIDEELLNLINDIFVEVRANGVAYFPEVPHVLEALKKLNYSLGVISNTSSEAVANRILFELKLSKFFDIVVTSADFGVRKPYPGIFLYAIRKLDAAPSEAVFVGDSIRDDVLGAKSAGMKAILVDREGDLQNFTAADAIIRDLKELLEVLNNFNCSPLTKP